MLEPGDVVLYRVDLRVRDPERRRALERTLSADEQYRATAFRLIADRTKFVVTRAWLRRILADVIGCVPNEIAIATRLRGKPSLPAHPNLRFNVSHSGELALIAVSLGREVGVDVERRVPGRVSQVVARTFFTSRESEELARLSPDLRDEGRLRCWCRKEAYVKARGGGLFTALDSFDVAVNPNAAPTVPRLLATRPDAHDVRRWDVRDLDVASGYVAAIAVEGTTGRLEAPYDSLAFDTAALDPKGLDGKRDGTVYGTRTTDICLGVQGAGGWDGKPLTAVQ